MVADWEPSKISLAWKVSYTLVCLSVFGVFAAFSQPDRGVVAGFSTAAIVLAARIRWDLHVSMWFWSTIGTLFVVHAALVYAWGWRITIKPTIILAPLALLDFVAVISLLFFLERSLEGKIINK